MHFNQLQSGKHHSQVIDVEEDEGDDDDDDDEDEDYGTKLVMVVYY